MFSRIAGGFQTVAATAVKITRTALEEDGEYPQDGHVDDSAGEGGVSVQDELDAYKSMVTDMEMQQAKVGREYQALFAEQETALARLRKQVASLGGTVAPEDEGKAAPKPGAAGSGAPLVAGELSVQDQHRLIAENERLEASVKQWTAKVKHYIAEKTRVTAELYLRDKVIAKREKAAAELQRQLDVQREIVEHFATEKTNIHTKAANDERAMDKLVEEYSRLSSESEAQFAHDARIIASLRAGKEKLMQQVQELQEKTQFQAKAIDDLTSPHNNSISHGELNMITELRAALKAKDQQLAMVASQLHESKVAAESAAQEHRNPIAADATSPRAGESKDKRAASAPDGSSDATETPPASPGSATGVTGTPSKAATASSAATIKRLKLRVRELEAAYDRDVADAARHVEELAESADSLEAELRRVRAQLAEQVQATKAAEAAAEAAGATATGAAVDEVVAEAVARTRAQSEADGRVSSEAAVAEEAARWESKLAAAKAEAEANLVQRVAEAVEAAKTANLQTVAAVQAEAKKERLAALARLRESLEAAQGESAAAGQQAAVAAAVEAAQSAAAEDKAQALAAAQAKLDEALASAAADLQSVRDAAEADKQAALARAADDLKAAVAAAEADKEAALAAAGSDKSTLLRQAEADRDAAVAAAQAAADEKLAACEGEKAAALARVQELERIVAERDAELTQAKADAEAAAVAAREALDAAVQAERKAQLEAASLAAAQAQALAEEAAAQASAREAELVAAAEAQSTAHTAAMAAAAQAATDALAAEVAATEAKERAAAAEAASAAADAAAADKAAALAEAHAAAAAAQAKAVADAVAEATQAHTAALAAREAELLQQADEARSALTAQLKAEAATAQAAAVEAAQRATQAAADEVMAAKLAECATDKAAALQTAADEAAAALAKALEEARAAAAAAQEAAVAAAVEAAVTKTKAEAAAAEAVALAALEAKKQQELDELQARIAKMEAQMATIEADIRAQVATEQAAAIKAEREEADRRVAAKEAEIEEFKELYAKEALARKKIHNKLLDIQGNIRVFARLRPVLDVERKKGRDVNIAEYPLQGELIIKQDDEGVVTKRFEFDQVFKPDSTQEEVFNDVKPFVTSVLDGYNVCIFAYGQTGSGKTYTMEGPPENRGVNFRALARLFTGIEERTDEVFELEISMLEIYNECVFDLLVEPPRRASDRKKLDIRKRANGSVFVQGLKRVPVATMETVEEVVSGGSKNRAAGSHDMNEHSSRSHLVLAVYVKSTNNVSGRVSRGKLNLIDLAGSERISKTSASGDRLKEAQNINRSLSALGDVVAALAKKDSKHVPYRNSKLTFLLQDSLGGNSKVLMFVNASPVIYNVGETMCSLNFARRCRSVALGQAKKQSESGEVAKLRRQLAALQNGAAGAGGAGAGSR